MKNGTVQATTANVAKNEKRLIQQFSKEALAILEDDTTIYLPHKYFAAQRSMIIEDVQELHESHPDLPIRQIIVQILSTLPDFLPPDNIVEVTRLITKQWQKLQAEKHELVAA